MTDYTTIGKLEAYNRVSPDHLAAEKAEDSKYINALLGFNRSPVQPLNVSELRVVRDTLLSYLSGVRRTSIALGASGEVITAEPNESIRHDNNL
jgi:hypothetical protein